MRKALKHNLHILCTPVSQYIHLSTENLLTSFSYASPEFIMTLWLLDFSILYKQRKNLRLKNFLIFGFEQAASGLANLLKWPKDVTYLLWYNFTAMCADIHKDKLYWQKLINFMDCYRTIMFQLVFLRSSEPSSMAK